MRLSTAGDWRGSVITRASRIVAPRIWLSRIVAGARLRRALLETSGKTRRGENL